MIDQQEAARPQVRGTVILSAFIAAVSLVTGWSWLSPIIDLRGVAVPSWYTVRIVFELGLGLLMLADAYLIARYRKRGLQLGVLVYVIYLGNILYEFIGGVHPDVLGWLTIVLAVAALYYIYRYMTHDPEQRFFT